MTGGIFFAAWTFCLILSIPFLYQFALEITRVSPLLPLDADVALDLLSSSTHLVLLGAGTLAIIVCLPGALLTRLSPSRKHLFRLLVAAVATLLLALCLLPAVENFFYIVLGKGLKTSASLSSKLGVGGIALALAIAFVRPLLAIGGALGRSRFLGAIFALAYLGALVTIPPATSRTITAEPGEGFNPYNIVILSSDGLDAARMGVYGYERETTPFLSATAGEFLIFRNAFTNNGNTTGSITALLTGRSPLATHVVYPPDLLLGEDSTLHLPAILGSLGYLRSHWGVPHFADPAGQNIVGAFDRIYGMEAEADITGWLPVENSGIGGWFVRRTVADIHALSLDVLQVREATNAFEQITGGMNTVSDDQRLAGVLTDIRSDRPVFVNVHFMDTHGPGFSPREPHFSAGIEQKEPFQMEFLDDAIRDFDARVAEVYRALEDGGKLESTILIVTSDHGKLYNAASRIPLLIRLPNRLKTGDVHENVQRIDLAPTILSLIGIPVPAWMEGHDLLQPIPPERIILATNTSSAQVGEHGQWIHAGSRRFGKDHRVTAIRCDRYFRFEIPPRLVESQVVAGTTSPCRLDDASQEAAEIARILAARTSHYPATR